MITREQVAELRKFNRYLESSRQVSDSQIAPIFYETYKELLDTIDALWKVVEAAKDYVHEIDGPDARWITHGKIRVALAALDDTTVRSKEEK